MIRNTYPIVNQNLISVPCIAHLGGKVLIRDPSIPNYLGPCEAKHTNTKIKFSL